MSSLKMFNMAYLGIFYIIPMLRII